MSQVETKAIADQAVTDPKLTDTGVTAGTYGGTLTMSVNSKGRVTAVSAVAPITSTATTQTSAGAALSVISGMQVAPGRKGTFMVEFTADMTSQGSVPSGTLGIYKNGALIDYSKRTVAATATVFSGLISLTTGNISVSSPAHTKAWVTLDQATDVVTVQWQATSGAISCGPRALVLVQIG